MVWLKSLRNRQPFSPFADFANALGDCSFGGIGAFESVRGPVPVTVGRFLHNIFNRHFQPSVGVFG